MEVDLAEKLIASWVSRQNPFQDPKVSASEIPRWMFDLPGKVEIANEVLANHGFPNIKFELADDVYPPAALSGRIEKSQKAEFIAAVQKAVAQSGLTNASGNWELAMFYFRDQGQELSINSVVM